MRNYILSLIAVASVACFPQVSNAQSFEGYNASGCRPANIISRSNFGTPIVNLGNLNGPAGDMVPGAAFSVSSTFHSGWRNLGSSDIFVVCWMPDEFNKSFNIQESFAFVQNGSDQSRVITRQVMLVNSGISPGGAVVAETGTSGLGSIGETQINGGAITMGDGTQYKSVVFRLPSDARFFSQGYAYF
jgi:hypothetical protein